MQDDDQPGQWVTPSGQQLASFNIGATRFPLSDPRMADFTTNLDKVNRIAERAAGFVWRRISSDDSEFCARVLGCPDILLNLTVWESVAALRAYVWNTVHKHFYARRSEWFLKVDEAQFVMWWIPAGHIPSVEEAAQKLLEFRNSGEASGAFDWGPPPPNAPLLSQRKG
jgi:hypothetical protein